jgi:hypothetical protein
VIHSGSLGGAIKSSGRGRRTAMTGLVDDHWVMADCGCAAGGTGSADVRYHKRETPNSSL